MDFKNLKPGEIVESKIAVLRVSEKKTIQGKPYLIAELSHQTGVINGKVWDDSLANATLKQGRVYLVTASVDSYRDELNLNITKATQLDEEIDLHLAVRPTLVFDIETAGQKFSQLSKWDQNYLVNVLQKHEEDKKEAKQRTGLYPLYGQVVSIGMVNPNSGKGMVFLQNQTSKKIKNNEKGFKYECFNNEKKLLTKFWQTATRFERFVTFNGFSFDFPFLQFRSAFHKVKVPFEVNGRQDFHIDLMQKFRGTSIYRLEALCRALGISNPKAKGVSGLHVSNLFTKGEIQKIADYVARDAKSTADLYEAWRRFMSGRILT